MSTAAQQRNSAVTDIPDFFYPSIIHTLNTQDASLPLFLFLHYFQTTISNKIKPGGISGEKVVSKNQFSRLSGPAGDLDA